MLKMCCLTAVIIAFGAAPALAQSSTSGSAPGGATKGAAGAKAGMPAHHAVVIDADSKTAVVVPVNPRTRESPEVVATLKALSATGQVKPGEIVQIVVRHGDKVTEVISNAPVPNP